ncbi:hypothetical protein GGS23DRAFT_120541 [Durotheca rogersii]|uniref:uncharacterized protein n=1 Tax=Durotheca rogersii TaxID=419775 RepID=UPI0022203B5D|nr:uncharacterized protein GGS23DRAFT_120541 [Durotheca rogersii]KAI5861954.1 hypothetical protein GGS23DRAFT_120541 [Durotheca rogersii]
MKEVERNFVFSRIVLMLTTPVSASNRSVRSHQLRLDIPTRSSQIIEIPTPRKAYLTQPNPVCPAAAKKPLRAWLDRCF